MLITDLTEMIGKEISCRCSGAERDRDIKRFCFWQDGLLLNDTSCLYIDPEGKIGETEVPLVILTTEDAAETCIRHSHIVMAVKREQMSGCLNLLTMAFFQEQARTEEFNRLLSGPAEQTPFHEIINHAAEFLDRSLILTDMSFHVIDYSTTRAITDPVWKGNVKRGYCSYEFIEAVNVLIPDHTMPGNSEAFFVNCDASKENKLCSILYYQTKPIGYLVLLDNEKGILPYHIQYLPKITRILLLSLKHVPNFRSLFINASENVFLNLLEGKSGTPDHVDHTDYLDPIQPALRLPKTMRCLLFILKNPSRHNRYYLQKHLYSLLSGGSVFLYQSYVIAVVDAKEAEKLKDTDPDQNWFRNIREIGVSSVFRTPEEFPYNFQCANVACEMAHKLGSTEQIHYYDKYQFFHILSTCGNEKLLTSYIHPAFEMLREYDSANETSLLKTLHTYLEHGLNAKETATALYLHRNTLTYRLNKIRELTGISFEDLETVFRISCSFRINELLKVYEI